jgi:hypothetical protein
MAGRPVKRFDFKAFSEDHRVPIKSVKHVLNEVVASPRLTGAPVNLEHSRILNRLHKEGLLENGISPGQASEFGRYRVSADHFEDVRRLVGKFSFAKLAEGSRIDAPVLQEVLDRVMRNLPVANTAIQPRHEIALLTLVQTGILESSKPAGKVVEYGHYKINPYFEPEVTAFVKPAPLDLEALAKEYGREQVRNALKLVITPPVEPGMDSAHRGILGGFYREGVLDRDDGKRDGYEMYSVRHEHANAIEKFIHKKIR